MSSQILCVVKIGFKPVSDDNDPLPISNIGALKFGLKALLREDSEDNDRAEQDWSRAKALLIEEQEDDTGAGATGKIQVEDDFELARLGDDAGYWYW